VKKKQEQTDCPLQLSRCYQESCRYYLKFEGRCAYEQIKAMEKRKAAEAENRAPARRVSDGREVVRMEKER
jgi:hypothetical protein